jgi:hypothetical protein
VITLNNDGSNVGDNAVAVNSEDVFYLTVTQPGSNPVADATLLFDGSDVNLNTSEEHLQSLTLTISDNASSSNDEGGTTRLLYVVKDPANLSTQEEYRQKFMINWGFDVILMDDEATELTFAAELQGVNPADVVYVSQEVEPPACNGAYRDEFNDTVWSGSDGTLSWSGPWVEVGESDGPTSGDIVVTNDQSNYQLRIRDNDNGGEGVERVVDLSGATTAMLTFDYGRSGLDRSSDYVAISKSSNGAAGPWTELDQIGTSNDSSYQPYTRDISAYISATSAIRLLSSPKMGGSDIVWFDNIQIECNDQ